MKTAKEGKRIKDLLPQFYRDYDLPPDGGDSENTVRLELTDKFYVYIPNWNDRRKAVLMHDVHHLITGYKAEIKGETEIASWEIASDCSRFPAAILLNGPSILFGLFLHPKKILRAFLRGRRTSNLYTSGLTEEEILNSFPEDLKKRLGLTKDVAAIKWKFTDIPAFTYWLTMSIFLNVLIGLFVPVILGYTIAVRVRKKRLAQGEIIH